jgi:hypothetical protein
MKKKDKPEAILKAITVKLRGYGMYVKREYSIDILILSVY